MSKNKVFNVKIVIANNCTSSLNTIADDFNRDITELDRMIRTIDKILEKMREEK